MSKRTVIDCDLCGGETEKHVTIKIPNGTTRQFDGHTSDIFYDYEEKDLCIGCSAKLFKYLFSHKRDMGTDIESETVYRRGQYIHPDPRHNDAVALALKFFNIKPK